MFIFLISNYLIKNFLNQTSNPILKIFRLNFFQIKKEEFFSQIKLKRLYLVIFFTILLI